MSNPIVAANIHITEKGNLLSPEYDDLYASNSGALEERDYNFLQANQLQERFTQLQPKQRFCVAETGFGTGLNFVLTASCFFNYAPADAKLFYYSVEKHPFKADDLEKLLQRWPQFSEITKKLIKQYPPLLSGFHRISIGSIELTLIFDEAESGLEQVHAQVDAWFLDGFTPKKNPMMWNHQLFKQVARLSDIDTTYATFTAARSVRDQLKGNGFSVKKRSGFGKKREMIYGQFMGLIGPHPAVSNQFYSLASVTRTAPKPRRRIAIIGAGLAGCATAYALNKRGAEVHLIEKNKAIALQASGNAQAAVYLKPGSELSFNNRFYLHAYNHTLRQVAFGLPLIQCGFLQLQHNEKERKKQHELLTSNLYPEDFLQPISALQATQIAGIPIEQAALYYPHGGRVDPTALCDFWSAASTVHTECQVLELNQNPQQRWQLKLSDASKDLPLFDDVVVCNASDATQFEQLAYLPTKSIRGQVSQTAAKGQLSKLKSVICAEHYLTPSTTTQVLFGATFSQHETTCTLRIEDHISNISNLESMVPSLKGLLSIDDLQGKAGLRCTTPDYLPIVGPIVPAAAYSQQFKHIQNPRLRSKQPAPSIAGLYVNIGHGSKGCSSCYSCGELIAQSIMQEPLSMEKDLVAHLHPSRFLIRAIKRKKSPYL